MQKVYEQEVMKLLYDQRQLEKTIVADESSIVLCSKYSEAQDLFRRLTTPQNNKFLISTTDYRTLKVVYQHGPYVQFVIEEMQTRGLVYDNVFLSELTASPASTWLMHQIAEVVARCRQLS